MVDYRIIAGAIAVFLVVVLLIRILPSTPFSARITTFLDVLIIALLAGSVAVLALAMH